LNGVSHAPKARGLPSPPLRIEAPWAPPSMFHGGAHGLSSAAVVRHADLSCHPLWSCQ